MRNARRTPAGDAVSDLMLDLFRLNSMLLTAGDRLVAGLGLTSARWQILGAIVAAERPQPVAWLARDLGANRQNVQRIINDLEKEELVAFEPNPHHRRAQLVVLTDKGRRTYRPPCACRPLDQRPRGWALGQGHRDDPSRHGRAAEETGEQR